MLLAKRPRLCSAPPLAVRWLSTPAPAPPYRILFFGADQFSCDVFHQLHAASKGALPVSKGRSAPAPAHSVPLARPADLVQECTVVTPPDQRIGRRGKQLHRRQ